jgi:hypothetical protein
VVMAMPGVCYLEEDDVSRYQDHEGMSSMSNISTDRRRRIAFPNITYR